MEPFYKAYFQNLVAVSVWLKTFFYINDPYDLQAFDAAVKNIQQWPALLLDQYNYEVEEKASRNYMQGISGQFTILQKTTKGSQATIEAARVAAEQICNLIISRMRNDLGEGGNITMDETSSGRIFYKVKAKVQRVGPISADYYGATCMFIWETSFVVPVSNTDWTDL